ncbi:MAG: hypothetical protein IPM82_28200 [Saprospiraceae bacterium]|nr:hypothetical protein [Saprospiraceae bacterium]
MKKFFTILLFSITCLVVLPAQSSFDLSSTRFPFRVCRGCTPSPQRSTMGGGR